MPENFTNIENKYWDLIRQLKLSEYLIPDNLLDEKINFIRKYENGEKYNPIFKYQADLKDANLATNQLLQLKKEFSQINKYPEIADLYINQITENIEFIEKFSKRASDDFVIWLSDLHGKPSEHIFNQANSLALIINQANNFIDEAVTLSPEEAKSEILLALEKRKFFWDIDIKNIPAKMSVNSLTKSLVINQNTSFTQKEIQRLIAHEIDTHILRAENGAKQSFIFFRNGIDYIETEEGLAIWSEAQTNTLSEIDMLKYCIRVIACYQCFTNGFYDLFNIVNQLFKNTEKSFDLVARIKRGLINTEVTGGYTKDQVYFSGYQKIRNLSMEEIKTLYIGKISIEQIPLAESFAQKRSLIYPEFIFNYEKYS